MLAERDIRQTPEKTLIIQLKNGKKLSVPDKELYRYTDVADALSKKLGIVSAQLHSIIESNPDIRSQIMTLGKLKKDGELDTLEIGTRPQTKVFGQEVFIELVKRTATFVKAPSFRKASSEKTPIKPAPESKKKKPRNNKYRNFNDVKLNPEKPQEILSRPSREMSKIEDPRRMLAANSVIKTLSLLANGTLQEITKDIKEFLEQVATKHVKLTRFEDDHIEGLLKKILDSDEPKRLKRFFRVNLEAILDYLWNTTGNNQGLSKEEKKIMEICSALKNKGFDREKAVNQIYAHFGIQIPTRPEPIVA